MPGRWTTDASSCVGWGRGGPGANDRQLFLLQEAFALGAQEGSYACFPARASDHHKPILNEPSRKPDSQGLPWNERSMLVKPL